MNQVSFGGRLLIVVAHQDDEIACSAVMQRVHDVLVVFAADGAPTTDFFWSSYGSRRRYAP